MEDNVYIPEVVNTATVYKSYQIVSAYSLRSVNHERMMRLRWSSKDS